MSLLSDWPANSLEHIPECPLCHCLERQLLHDRLVDKIFFAAPGHWSLWRCTSCHCAYLSPRPTTETIHMAYQGYYTHTDKSPLDANTLRGLRWLQRVMANGYKNWRFGTSYYPANPLGIIAAYLIPSIRIMLNRQFRQLPALSGGGRVLDVGCGDACFLDNARNIGWDAVGTETDSVCVENARKRGFKVYQHSATTLEEIIKNEDQFDAITLCHVIEHVHDPILFLSQCYQLLKPGGQLWIETPNIDSLGHSRFGQNWRGLEVPRHLVIFNSESLLRALAQAGFINTRNLPQPSVTEGIYTMSTQIEHGLDPNTNFRPSLQLYFEVAISKIIKIFLNDRREFLSVVAFKKSF